MKSSEMVSVIIPTRNRHQLILRAIRSVLNQTYSNLEVIVVVDGPDTATCTALASVHDGRLRHIVLSAPQGAQVARNTGIQAAHGDWIALLDDDDEWLPTKTELQMRRALSSRHKYPIVSCKFICRTSSYELIWPRREPYSPLSEYLLARNSLSMGEGVLSTITLLFPKALGELSPFTLGLTRCQEVDWTLRAVQHEGVGVEFVREPLAVTYRHDELPSITAVPDWKASLRWVDSVRGLITPRAYASYLAVTVASQAARQRDWNAWLRLFTLILTRGRPKWRDIAFFLSVWCVPRKLQLAVRKAGW